MHHSHSSRQQVWVSGLLLNISITHVSNASPLFSGIINQTTASVTYTNLTEGSLWVNSTICDATSRCTNATQHFIIDLTGPSMPSIFSADSVALQNGSLVLQSGDDLMFSSGSDGGSGTSFTRCNGTGRHHDILICKQFNWGSINFEFKTHGMKYAVFLTITSET